MGNRRTMLPRSQRNTVSSKSWRWYFLFLIAALYPMFLWLFPRALTLGLFFGVVAMTVVVVFLQTSRAVSLGPESMFLPLGLIAIVGSAINENLTPDLLFFVGMLLFACMLPFVRGWAFPAMHALLTLFLIHAIATIAFFVFPALHTLLIAHTAIGNFPTAIDYRSGLTAHYSWNGMYCALGVVIAVPLALRASRRVERTSYYTIAALLMVALVLTTKRGPLFIAVLAVALTMIVSLRTHPLSSRKPVQRANAWWMVLLGAALIGFLASNPSARMVVDRFFLDTGNVDQLTSGRVQLWSSALELWASSPLVGVGWGGYRHTWSDGGTIVTSVSAHNVVLNLLAETGILGVSLFTLAFILALARTFTSLRLRRVKESRQGDPAVTLLLVSVSIQLYFAMYAMIGNPLYDPPTIMAYFLGVSLSVAYGADSDRSRAAQSQRGRVGKQA